MTDHTSPSEGRLAALIQHAVESSLSDDDRWELLNFAVAEPDACERYCDHMAIHAELRLELSAASMPPSPDSFVRNLAEANPKDTRGTDDIGSDRAAEPDAQVSGSAKITQRPQARVRTDFAANRPTASPLLGFLADLRRVVPGGDFVVGGLVLLAVMGSLWGVAFYMRTERPGRIALQQSDENPATASRTKIGSLDTGKDSRWSRESTIEAAGGVHIGERYQLNSGRALIVLSRGTRVAVEGPASWQFVSEQRLQLDAGCLAAHVPPAAVGFTVVTPTAEIIDLGTDFGVVVDDRNQSKLAVTKGAVKLIVRNDLESKPGRPAPSPLRVTAGEAVTVSRIASGAAVTRSGVLDAGWTKQIAHLNEPLGEPVRRRSVAYQAWPDGAAGNQFDFVGSLGLDFKVARPIRVYSLGVFDHLGDGIDPSSTMTVQLWSRNTHATEDLSHDTGDAVLASTEMTAEAPGELKFGHRFVALAQPVTLSPGDYTIVAHGFSARNPDLNFGMTTSARSEVDTQFFAIVPLGSRALYQGAVGTFPSKHEPLTVRYCAGSFEFEREE